MLDARVPLALGASVLLHGAALALADRLPLGWPQQATEWAGGAGVLHARLRASDAHPLAAPASQAAPGLARRERPVSQPEMPALPGIIPAAAYLPAEQLDERPQIRSHVEPAFPLDANAPAGRVVLRLLIGETGAVDKVQVIESEPPGPFGVAAVEAFQPARFSPGRKDGAAVKSAVIVELRFGETPIAGADLRRQDVPLFQPPRQAPRRRVASAQEKP